MGKIDLGVVISKGATIMINNREELGAIRMGNKKLIQIGRNNGTIQHVVCSDGTCAKTLTRGKISNPDYS